MQEIKTAMRALARRPGFTLIAILTLALGIGANAAIFSVVDAVLLQPLPFAQSDRLVMPWAFSADVQRKTGFDRLPSSPGDVTDFIRAQHHLRTAGVDADVSGEPDRWRRPGTAGRGTGQPQLPQHAGRPAGPRPGFHRRRRSGGRFVLIGHGLWQRRYGGADVVDRAISLNGEQATIVGVLPAGFHFPAGGELPTGLGFSPQPEVWSLDVLTPAQKVFRGGKSFALVGRLRPGMTAAAARADLNTIAADIARQSPSSNAGWTVNVVPLRDQLVGSVRPALIVLLSAVGFVLIIACANVANLLLVRASTRQREIAVRYALGAERWHILRQLMVECLMLSLAAGVLGLAIGWWGLHALLRMLPAGLPALAGASLDWRVIAFTALVSIVTGLVFGAAPALHTSRVQLNETLREGARGSVGNRRGHRTRNVLVVVEVALAGMLLVLASLLIQTFVRLLNVNVGFQADSVLTMEVALPRLAYPGARPAEFFQRLIARLSVVPGVEGVAATSSIPLAGTENLRQVTIESRERPEPGKEIVADYRMITDGYFKVMGIPHVAGEPLPRESRPDSPPVLLINSMMADTVFPGENAVGRRMKLVAYDQSGPWYTVIGVVGDTRHTALDGVVRPQVYVSHSRRSVGTDVCRHEDCGRPRWLCGGGTRRGVRARPESTDRTAANDAVDRLRGRVPPALHDVPRRRLRQLSARAVARRPLRCGVVFGRRTNARDRLAICARGDAGQSRCARPQLRACASSPSASSLGLAVAFVLARFLETQLFGVTAHDPGTFIVVALLLLAAAIVGCLIPARRATRIDPMTALRTQ